MNKYHRSKAFSFLFGIINIAQFYAVLTAIAAASFSYASAQGQGSALTGSATDLDKSLQSSITQTMSADASKEQSPVDNAISPEHYRIGPSDVLSIFILPFPGAEQPLIVSADNSVILPRIGILSLEGKTLAQARDTIAQIYARRNPNSSVAVSLRRARTVYCSIRGNVAFPGVKIYPATTRISSIVALANQAPASSAAKPTTAKFTDDASISAIKSELSSYASRNITILHRDGSSDIVDLEKAKYGASPELDLTAREGDEIVVPYEPLDFPTISISGAIARPIAIAFKNGDKLSMLLRAGRGLQSNADMANAILTMPDGERRNIKLNEKGELAEADITLRAGASLIIGYISKTEETRLGSVEIKGEVAHQGAFAIIPNKTRLKEVVEQAGGFTQNAYLPLAYVVRREKNKPNIEIDKPNWPQLQYTDLTFEDTSRLIIHNALKRPIASTDFVKAFRDNSPEDNILLSDGDIVVIPENPRHVYVYGQVNQPGYIDFSPGKRLGWYVERAGGYAVGAKKKLSRIIKGKNKVWMEDDDNIFVEAGDEIYVAPPTNAPVGYDLQFYTFVGTLLTTLAFLTSTLVGIFKK